MAGYEKIDIGDTLTATDEISPIEYYDIDQPTMAMNFRVNDSPLCQVAKEIT
ncbi:MAG: hypothetical protein U5K69_04720 [Balneolaceae bacterium]|nr:hypothetical protein [Balneolaceae bacterium]